MPPFDDDPPTSTDEAKTLVRHATNDTFREDEATRIVELRRRDTVQEPRFGARPEMPSIVQSPDELVDEGGFETRYVAESLLGVGGMGEVTSCRDRRIGRQVAMKVLLGHLGKHKEVRERFEREARLQGQLEHPSIVPVYDVGVTPEGASYFTMRRLRGLTLEEVLHRLREGDDETAAQYTRRRLLVSFVSLCFAVAYAHDRGVLHRDLKPGNVMLGEYREVYLLDWGLAKLAIEAHARHSQHGLFDVGLDEATATGLVLGTPGYMAPEQVRGEVQDANPRTDIYALGAILFEILTLHPLIPGSSTESLLAQTLRGVDARASLRFPSAVVPPELEAICVRATALDRDARFPTARALSAAVERFLDGERDLATRKKLASEHAHAAAEAAREGRATGPGAPEMLERGLREASSALTLDPTNADALRTIARLLADVSDVIPEEAKPELLRQTQDRHVAAARATMLAYAGATLFIPTALVLGVRDWTFFFAAILVGLLGVTGAVLTSRGRLGRAGTILTYILGVVAITLTSTIAGWAMIIPSMTASHTLRAVLFGERRLRPFFLAFGAVPLVLPFALEALGVLPPTYSFEGSQIAVHARMTDLPALTAVVLLGSALLLITAPAVLLGRMRDALTRAEERLFLRAWRMRRILPEPVGAAVEPSSARAR